MKRPSMLTAIPWLLASLALGGIPVTPADAQEIAHLSSHWTYEGALGPDYWGSLNPAYGSCAQGVNQSPINLKGFIEAELPPIDFAYHGQGSEIYNTGHGIQVNFPPATAAIRIDDITFELKQCHFHAPAEHLIDDKVFAMEAHFVHADPDGHLAVVALMMQEGEANNPALDNLWRELPHRADGPHPLSAPFFAQSLLPVDRDYVRYNGSLTTPPCTEGVRWLVLKQAIPVSAEQVKRFTSIMMHPNNRPVQPINARPVLR